MPAEKDRRHPIIFVRGYAGGQSEVEETTADPYNGFNIGSTKVRQAWTGEINRHFFESPLVRLMKEYGYSDVYSDGRELPPDKPVPERPIVIYRYYDITSKDLGTGVREEIEQQARGLAELILNLRDRICGEGAAARSAFRVYLIAHSMGGLVCRAMLQSDDVLDAARLKEARAAVDKVVTYGTPHNGIDLRLIGNVPGFFTRNNADNFNRKRMREYLGLPPGPDDESVATLNGKFDPDRFFTVVGTNQRDYEVGGGAVRAAVGPMSDGLVRIANATVSGPWTVNGKQELRHSPRAFVHRAHSGHYGIVNSEEGFQNVARFLFGDARVDGLLEVHSISLPPKIERIYLENKEKEKRGEKIRPIRASYHFEVIVRVRGALWDLHRRTVAEGSAVFRSFDELLRHDQIGLAGPRHPHLFSTFLSRKARVKTNRQGLGFTVDLAILVPQYEVDNKLWFDDHYEGGYLFRDKINLEAIPDDSVKGGWRLKFGYDSRTPNRATTEADATPGDGLVAFRVPVKQTSKPGIDAHLVLTARGWA
ncbi:MAG: hypothetical protein KJZ69_02195 [Phycisphaerales bacterium]|nr:hypothetical protein [Phycisphaerales bacterium]